MMLFLLYSFQSRKPDNEEVRLEVYHPKHLFGPCLELGCKNRNYFLNFSYFSKLFFLTKKSEEDECFFTLFA